MNIKLVQSKAEWDICLATFSYTTPFLAWEWLEFETALGNKVKPYGLYDGSKLIGLLPIKYIYAKRGKYLHLRHAPLIHWDIQEEVKAVLLFLKNEGKGLYFVRISPLLDDTKMYRELLANYRLKPSLTHASDAELTLVIDLTKSQEQLFNELRKTTRQLIVKAQKMNICINMFDNPTGLSTFFTNYQETVKRQKWHAYSEKYIELEVKTFTSANSAYIFTAFYETKPISSAVFITTQSQVIYHHGGSLSDFRQIPAMYLIQWEAIKFFKAKGFKVFNLWGVSPKDQVKHPWHGLSLFKRGFSNQELAFVHAHDLVLNPFGYITRWYEFIEKKLRGY